jgi:hypothetical protein
MSKSLIFSEQNTTALSTILGIVTPGISKDQAFELAAMEIDNLKIHALTIPAITECEPVTSIAAVRSIIRMGLTLDPNLGMVYVKTRNFKAGNTFYKRLELQPTVNGLLYMALQTGTLQDHKRPTITYNDKNQVESVTFEYKTAGEWKSITKDAGYFQRLSGFSAKQNKGSANALYSSHNGFIDPEFAATKVMRHVLSKLGINPMNKRQAQIEFTPVIAAEITAAENEDLLINFQNEEE